MSSSRAQAIQGAVFHTVPTEFTQIPKQQSAEDHEIVKGTLDSYEEALWVSELDIAGLTQRIGADGQGDQGEGVETQEGQDGGQGEAQEGEAAGETGTGNQSSKQGGPDRDPEGTVAESEAPAATPPTQVSTCLAQRSARAAPTKPFRRLLWAPRAFA
ncbi:MAG: hypothetical protein ACJATT_005623 [Myxococcota bacterium]